MCLRDTEKKKKREMKKKKAYGLIDRIVNKMPEIHIPSYMFAGPGTRLQERLARGDKGKNKLDVACKYHDLAYSLCEDSKSRRKADKVLIERAFKRVYSRDAKLDERAAALLVSGLMSAKVGLTKIGLGLGTKNTRKRMKHRVNRSTKRNSIAFSKLVRGAKQSMKKTKQNDSASLNQSIKAAIRSIKDMKRGKTVKIPRILKLPKFGGSIQTILPILSGLSALGSITASTVGVVKAIKDIEIAKKQLIEQNRRRQHTSGQHKITNGKKIGRALNLIYKTGSGFYLKPHKQ